MKKKLESELISIAHRILKLKGREDVDRMHEEVSKLYEKLTVLKFAQENFEDKMPSFLPSFSFFDMLDTAFNNKVSDNIEIENKTYINLDEVEDDGIMEPVMNKIKDMVAHMPADDSNEMDPLLGNSIIAETPKTIELENITADFAEIPEFEPIEEAQKRKSLNDKLKGKNLQIGLNDKLAFIKHLFEGSSEDYDRVISQLNTTKSLKEAQKLIGDFIKPDYNNWLGKEEYEERFMELLEGKFN